MRSMKLLEGLYGSLGVVNEKVQGLLGDVEDCPFTTILPLVAAGLLHEGIDEEALGDALTPARYFELRGVLVDAINESFPEPSGKAAEGDRAEDAPPGATSTTSPPFDSAAATASSGS